MSLSPEARDFVIGCASILLMACTYNYTMNTLVRCARGALEQRKREDRAQLAALQSPAVDAEPEGTGDEAPPRPLGSATGAPGEGSNHPRSTSGDAASERPPLAGE